MTKILYIKNMVCDRCRQVVQEELEQLGINAKNIQLGSVEVDTEENLDNDKIDH